MRRGCFPRGDWFSAMAMAVFASHADLRSAFRPSDCIATRSRSKPGRPHSPPSPASLLRVYRTLFLVRSRLCASARACVDCAHVSVSKTVSVVRLSVSCLSHVFLHLSAVLSTVLPTWFVVGLTRVQHVLSTPSLVGAPVEALPGGEHVTLDTDRQQTQHLDG